MAKQQKQAPLVGLRFTPEDSKLAKELTKKLGVGTSQILRMGLRKLAEAEGLR